MAQEIWFRSDIQNIIEGLALSLAQAQAFSGSAQTTSYHHGFLSALASIGSCLGISNLELTPSDRSIQTSRFGNHVAVSGPHLLSTQDQSASVDPDWPPEEPTTFIRLSR